MKTLLALPLLLLLTSFAPSEEEPITCDGCRDGSGNPSTSVSSGGSCNAFTTTELWTNNGLCFAFASSCANAPCSPFLRLRNHASPGRRVTLQGVIGKSRLGLQSHTTGPDTQLLATWTEVGCGEESSYSFTIETDCGSTKKVEVVSGAFSCSVCALVQ